MLVPLMDWYQIRMQRGKPSSERWSDTEGTFGWDSQDAIALAEMLAEQGAHLCRGELMVDLDYGESGIRGTASGVADDGLTPEQRASRLVDFLHEGAFCWRITMREYSK
jgi:hypothetical protein